MPRTERREVGEFLQVYRRVHFVTYLSRWQNRDTRRETPAAAWAAWAAGHETVLFSQSIIAVRKAMTYTDLLGTTIIQFEKL